MQPNIVRPEPNLRAIPDDELLRRLGELVSQSRRVEADLVAHIGEVDARGLYARQAFPSMYAYCTEALHLSEAEAYRRITVARASRKHEGLLRMLRDGRLHLSGITLLAPLLTPENREALLQRATHRPKREIERLVAELQPRPDAPSVMRKLPQPRTAQLSGSSQETSGHEHPRAVELNASRPDSLHHQRALGPAAALTVLELVPGRVGTAAPAAALCRTAPPTFATPPVLATPANCATRSAFATSAAFAAPTALASPATPSRPAVVQPLSAARYKVQFTASAELHDKLERLAALMRSEVPSGDLAAIIERAVSEKLERLEARRYAQTRAPRKTLARTDTKPTSRHVPAAVRRAVRARDGDRCRYVDEQGRRCSARDRLEFHHVHPFGMGGDHSPGNIRLLCPTHNRYLAEHDYGPAAIRRHRRLENEAPA